MKVLITTQGLLTTFSCRKAFKFAEIMNCLLNFMSYDTFTHARTASPIELKEAYSLSKRGQHEKMA